MAEKMSHNRFQLLLSYIHFSNKEESLPSNRLAKIATMLDLMNENLQSLYQSGEEVVIDETLIPWQGRLVFRQYIPNKAHKYEIKLFKLCSIEGYTYNLSVYTAQSQDGTRQVGLAKKVCTNLMSSLLNKGRTLYVDNFYTSYELATSFLCQKIQCSWNCEAKKEEHAPSSNGGTSSKG